MLGRQRKVSAILRRLRWDLAIHRSAVVSSRSVKDVNMRNSPTTQTTKKRDWEKETSKTRSSCRKRDTQPQSKGYMLTLTLTVTLSKEGIKEGKKARAIVQPVATPHPVSVPTFLTQRETFDLWQLPRAGFAFCLLLLVLAFPPCRAKVEKKRKRSRRNPSSILKRPSIRP